MIQMAKLRVVRAVSTRLLSNCLCAALIALCVPVAHGQGDRHPFTIEDSIARMTFSDPDETLGNSQCQLSPDKKNFVLVTTGSIWSTNQIESTIWVYDAARIREYLRSNRSRPFPPVRLWSVRGVPQLEQFHSYGSLITRIAWASDSSSLYFLVEQADRKRHLDSLSLTTHRLRSVSLPGQDIADFAEANGTEVYLVRGAGKPNATKGQRGSVGIDVTGQSLFHLFDPGQFPDEQSLSRPAGLWVRYHGRTWSLTNGRQPNGWSYPAAAQTLFHLAVAPDGHGLIAAQPVHGIKPSWRQLKSYSALYDLAHLQKPEGDPGLDRDWPWEYVYFDLRSGRSWSVADAPSSVAAGYGGTASASWSSDSKAVLITNTFLMKDASKDTSPQLTACAAAVSFVQQRQTSCVARSPYPAHAVFVRSGTLAAMDHVASLVWSDGQTAQYSYNGEGWVPARLTPTNTEVISHNHIDVELRQGLNESPKLWGVDAEAGKSKQLWNPNPQLNRASWGQVSVYRWTGEDGYHWRVGLVLPPSYIPGHRYPLVIQTHGFREGLYLVDGPYTTAFAAQALAARGMVVLQTEDRSDRHRVPPDQEAIVTAKGCFEAIQRLAAEGLIDPDRVGIVGFSRTCWYVETALEMFPLSFRAAVIVDGIDQGYMSDMLFCPTLKACRTDIEDADGGKPFGAGLQAWMDRAVSFHTERIQTPIRIEAIQWYSLLQEWDLYSSLRQQHKIVDLVYIPNGQHILQQPQQRYASQQGTVSWLASWLLDRSTVGNGSPPSRDPVAEVSR
jgi:dipeptidyl aminopeptidase/acylaminoacyl peptidase